MSFRKGDKLVNSVGNEYVVMSADPGGYLMLCGDTKVKEWMPKEMVDRVLKEKEKE